MIKFKFRISECYVGLIKFLRYIIQYCQYGDHQKAYSFILTTMALWQEDAYRELAKDIHEWLKN